MCIIKLSSIKKKDFSFAFKNKLASNRLFYRSSYISLYAIKEAEHRADVSIIRLGLAISKKTGKAAKRNKIKRRLKALARSNLLNMNNMGYYYIILTHKNVMQASYQNLEKDLTICLKRIK